MKRCWGVSIFAGAAALASAAAAQSAPLRLTLPDRSPEQATPGASWADPVLAPSDAAPLAADWRDQSDRWEISAAVRLVEESRLNAGDFQTGGLFETEAVVVRRFGDFRVGAAGYSARRAGEDVGRAPRLGSMRWKGSAVGPVVGYDASLLGQPATVSLRWYREMGTPGESGDTVSAAVALRF